MESNMKDFSVRTDGNEYEITYEDGKLRFLVHGVEPDWGREGMDLNYPLPRLILALARDLHQAQKELGVLT